LWLDATGWRRATLVGYTQIVDPVPISLDDENNIYLFLVQEDQNGFLPQIVALDRTTKTLWAEELETEDDQRPRNPKLLWDGENLVLFWRQGESLYTAKINTEGNITGEPQLISGNNPVERYDAASGPDGQISVWYSGDFREPGLYAAEANDGFAHSILVDPQGINADLHYDENGNLHAIWVHQTRDRSEINIYYAVYPQGKFENGLEQLIETLRIPATAGIEGPVLGLDTERGYLFWSVERRTGLEQGTVEASYLDFPLDNPTAISTHKAFAVPYSYHLNYSEIGNTGLLAGERVLPNEQVERTTTTISSIFPNNGNSQELAIALEARLPYLRNQEKQQVGVTFLEDGVNKSYQLLSFTIGNSRAPALTQDENNHLYLTWTEAGEEGFEVFLASTAPDIIESLSTITPVEFSQISAEMLFGMLSGIFFVYYPLIWMIVPTVVILATSRLQRRNGSVFKIGTVISLALAIAAYWYSKIIWLPGILTYVPFSAWLPMMPDSWGPSLQIFVPAFISLISLYLAWRFTYKRENDSPFFLMLIFMAFDSLATMSIYGVIIYSAI
jgi:hypothetical protein